MSAPIVAFVGRSESGKTGYLEKLLPELRRRGWKPASVKHVPQHYHADNPEKDTERHLAAGAMATVACARDAWVLTRPAEAEPKLEDIGQMLGDEFDIIIAEGFKQSGVPKVEVWREGIGEPLEGLTGRVAVVTSDSYPGQAPRLFSLEDIAGLADFLEEGYIRPRQERVSLLVNGQDIRLSAFPREITANLARALTTSLKNIPPVQWLELRLRNPAPEDH
ncbi:molybdopterin-guanine dinucleotide biosynthesis protein B [Dehalogenimonas lykanthroporepellens BL-DC-9]|nr:molybdopterin-guanine dinucleotide biosynthesis protein B [Dehalogenimonas lykanthroporepellens BL-DC-9]